MKKFDGFLDEAISARRIEELRRKGKGAAVDKKMAADGLKSGGSGGGKKELPTSAITKKAGPLAKSSSGLATQDNVQKARVKVDGKDDMTGQAGKQPGTTGSAAQSAAQSQEDEKKKKKMFKKKTLKKRANDAMSAVKSSLMTRGSEVGAAIGDGGNDSTRYKVGGS